MNEYLALAILCFIVATPIAAFLTAVCWWNERQMAKAMMRAMIRDAKFITITVD